MREILENIACKVSNDIVSLPESFERGKEICIGADGTPTCKIDKVAEDAILQFIEERDLPFNILSEEIGYLDRGYEKTLVIDPVDGTHNAILGIPFYSVSLAIGTSSLSDIEFGLVRNIVTGQTYYAERGKGAVLDGKKISTKSFDRTRSTFLVYMGMYSHPDTLIVARKSVKTRSLGCASLEMCMVADGRVDAYYMNCEVREKSIRVFDIAASALILREAGGDVVTLSGEPLDMPFDLSARSNFLAFGDRAVKEVII